MLKAELVGLAPIVIIGGGVFLVLGWYWRRQMKSPEWRKHLEYEARHQQHMERVEQVLERIAQALENNKKP